METEIQITKANTEFMGEVRKLMWYDANAEFVMSAPLILNFER